MTSSKDVPWGLSINNVGNWEGGGVKNWSKLPTDSAKNLADMGEGGVKNPEKLPTLFMDGPLPGWLFRLCVQARNLYRMHE